VERTRETFNAIHGPTASDVNDGRVITVFSPRAGWARPPWRSTWRCALRTTEPTGCAWSTSTSPSATSRSRSS
jgi:hypothetical protein